MGKRADNSSTVAHALLGEDRRRAQTFFRHSSAPHTTAGYDGRREHRVASRRVAPWRGRHSLVVVTGASVNHELDVLPRHEADDSRDPPLAALPRHETDVRDRSSLCLVPTLARPLPEPSGSTASVSARSASRASGRLMMPWSTWEGGVAPPRVTVIPSGGEIQRGSPDTTRHLSIGSRCPGVVGRWSRRE